MNNQTKVPLIAMVRTALRSERVAGRSSDRSSVKAAPTVFLSKGEAISQPRGEAGHGEAKMLTHSRRNGETGREESGCIT